MKDYYKTLDLQENASDDDIRKAYKKLAMQHHPDRGGDQTRFQEIQEAYSTLSDPQKRAQWEQQKQFTNHGNFGFSFNFGSDVNDIFGQFHGHPFFGHGFRQQQKNRDIRVTIDLDLASTLAEQVKHIDIQPNQGAKRTVQVNIPRGVHNNLQMRFPGHGDQTIPNIPPGDLYVDFRIHVPHDVRLDSLHVIKKIKLNCVDAVIGCKIDVDTIDHKTYSITIPPSTQQGTTFRIPQQGLFDLNHPVRGDLLIEIILETPSSITQHQLDKLKTLIK